MPHDIFTDPEMLGPIKERFVIKKFIPMIVSQRKHADAVEDFLV